MTTMSLKTKTAQGLRERLMRDTGGHIGIMTAVTIGFLLIGVGAAIDYSVIAKRSSSLQTFSDAAVLAAGGAKDMTDAEVRDVIENVIALHNIDNLPLDVTIDLSGDDIAVRIDTEEPTFLLGMVGKDTLPVSVESVSPKIRVRPINLALVVDVTKSMEGANITALQSAANDLVDEMEDIDSEVRMSLVPFNTYVNVGVDAGYPGPRNWIDMGKYGDTEPHCFTPEVQITAPNCNVTGTAMRDVYVDGIFMGREPYDVTTCTGGEYAEGTEEVCTPITYNWFGCMGSRPDALGLDPRFGAVRIPAALNRQCGPVMTPLTDDLDTIRDAVGELTARGDTYLPSGLIWGWRTLDGNAPYTEVNQARDDASNALILMTDGLNTRSRSNDTTGLHEWRNGDAGIALTRDMCAEMAQDGVDIFVVAYQIPGSDGGEIEGSEAIEVADVDGAEETVDVLQECATTASHYFTPDTASELAADFRNIAGMLDVTRLSYRQAGG